MSQSEASGHVAYSCSHCGYSPENTARWCALGCGSDYNSMNWVGPVCSICGKPGEFDPACDACCLVASRGDL